MKHAPLATSLPYWPSVSFLAHERVVPSIFDGGANLTTRPLERHTEQGKCRARNLGAAALPRELDGLYMPTTTNGVAAALMSEAL